MENTKTYQKNFYYICTTLLPPSLVTSKTIILI